MALGHGNGGVKGAVIGGQVKRPWRHVQLDGLLKVLNAIGHNVTQVAQGENPQRCLVFVNDDNAAHLLLVHQANRFAERGLRAAHHRMAHGQFTQAGVE